MIRIPLLSWPGVPSSPWVLAAYVLLALSIVSYAGFWIWAMVHAARTPRAPWEQRLLWLIAIAINPAATAWYWCVWKRWAFWTLFTPLIGLFISLPFVVRSLMSKADATATTNFLFALGSNALVIFFAVLLIYPVVLRFVVALHMTVNKHMDAMERNDLVTIMSLPLVGFGAALFYATRHQKSWAIASLLWFIMTAAMGKAIVYNVAPILPEAGEEKREEYIQRHSSSST